MNTVSIVIPAYNGWQLTHQLLFDLYKYCLPLEEVIIVNDASEDGEVYGGLQWWKDSSLLNIREIRNKENIGFLLSANKGLKAAKGNVVILISNDVRIRYSLTKTVSDIDDFKLVGGRILDFDTGWNQFGDKLFPYLEGWLLCATKETWKNLDYFDERFAPSDYEDIDISTKALEQGIILISLNDDRISHLAGQTYKYDDERRERTEINKEKFRKKWMK